MSRVRLPRHLFDADTVDDIVVRSTFLVEMGEGRVHRLFSRFFNGFSVCVGEQELGLLNFFRIRELLIASPAHHALPVPRAVDCFDLHAHLRVFPHDLCFLALVRKAVERSITVRIGDGHDVRLIINTAAEVAVAIF